MADVVRSIVRNPPNGGGGFNAVDIPSAYMRKTNNTPETTALATGTPAQTTITTTAGRLNMFTMPTAAKFKSTSATSFYATISGQISGAAASGAGIFKFTIYKNGSPAVNAADASEGLSGLFNSSLELKSYPLFSKCLIALDDEITVYVEDTLDPDDWNTWAFSLGVSFDGWA